MMTPEKAEMLLRIKMKEIHFAWDKYDEKEMVLKGLREFKDRWLASGRKWSIKNKIVYTLVNHNSTFEQDLERIYTLRDLEYYAYVMVYDKEHADIKYKKLARWVNNRMVFDKCKRWEEYLYKQ